MSLRLRFRFDGKCSVHPRYDPTRNGRPQDEKCEGCESLYVIYLYTKIASRKAASSSCGIARFSGGSDEEHSTEDPTDAPSKVYEHKTPRSF
jgi:hypothetical protein